MYMYVYIYIYIYNYYILIALSPQYLPFLSYHGPFSQWLVPVTSSNFGQMLKYPI